MAVVVSLSGVAALVVRERSRDGSTTSVARQAVAALTATTLPTLPAVPTAETVPSAQAARPGPTSTPPAPTTTTTTVPLVDAVAFVGDSLAENLGGGLAAAGSQRGVPVLDDSISGCGVAASGGYRLSGAAYELSPVCAGWSETWSVRLRRDRPKIVAIQVGRHEVLDRLYQGRWTNILDPQYRAYVRGELERGIRIAGADGARVVLLTAPLFHRPDRPSGGQWPENDPERVDRFNELLRELAAKTRNVSVIDLGAHANPGKTYVDVVDGVAVRSDGVHYSLDGVEWIGRWLLPQLAGLLRP